MKKPDEDDMEITIKQTDMHFKTSDIVFIFKNESNMIFLDSSMQHKTLGRFSFVGLNPFIVLKGNGKECYLNDCEIKCDIYEKIDELLNKYKSDTISEIPFIGGCIGYFSYDEGMRLEKIKKSEKDDLNIPEYYFIFYDNVIILDHFTGNKYISACGILKNPDESISLLEDKIHSYISVKQDTPGEENAYVMTEDITDLLYYTSNFSKDDYIKTIRKVKDYITDGTVYIANLTQRFSAKTNRDSCEIYNNLRSINPAPFSAFMKLEGFDIISSSPERFLKIRDRSIETRPVKGTRPRGRNAAEDSRNRNELINSEKDRAELLMIVDLERNDLSKVCRPFSVKVTDLYELEEYSTVFHLVATVTGELKRNISNPECFKACFPGGSITGAPKNSAMRIIKELEGTNRSLYTGCIGYFSFNGNADFNIVIRTIIKKDDIVYFGSGGGITCDSDEEAEYQETIDKAIALMRVI